MEKIININFQGRVIPIEEDAYGQLKVYIDSLRRHFAGEESSDEIINDIENRIAELLSDRLKRGAACITHSDLAMVMDSIGRLEDIEAAEGEEKAAPKSSYTPPVQEPATAVRGRFYRNADDKVIAGVCSGIAARAGIDPMIVRVVFVLLFGALVWIYLLLWVVVPSQSVQTSITRRLFRNPDDKVIAGVGGGLAVYLRVDSWIPRLLFALPLVLGVLSGGAHTFFWHWGWGFGPHLFAGTFGTVVLYVILWIALPYASSATEKLEMRGEKIDLNSIKAATQARAGSLPPRRRSGGLGRVIGILFKAFFLFIAGIMAVSLFGVLIGLLFAGIVAVPFTDFLFDGWQQYMLTWAGLVLFLGIPLLAFATWIIRRLMGVRSRRHHLGYIFAGLWFIGVASIIILTATLVHNFGFRSVVEDTNAMVQPTGNKLYINVGNGMGPLTVHHHRWYGGDNNGVPFPLVGNDSIWLNTVKIDVAQSADSLYHVYTTRMSRGATAEGAKSLAGHISFPISQHDSIVTLPTGFTVSNKDKFRNQQVLVTVEVPVGKTVQVNKPDGVYDWFSININRRNFNVERDWPDHFIYHSNRSYIMTPSGLINPLDSSETDEDDGDDTPRAFCL